MIYARVENGVVMELIPAVDPAFPEIPIEQRFHESIIAQLVAVPEDVSVEQNWTYDAENGAFAAPVESEPVEPEPAEEVVADDD